MRGSAQTQVIEEKPTPEQWDEVVHRFGRPQIVPLRWDRTDKQGVADHAPRTCNALLFVTDPLHRLLFVQKRKSGVWFLPMGGVKEKQSVLEGAATELWEEAGITFEPQGLPIAYVVDEMFKDGKLIRWHLLVKGTTIAGSAEPKDDQEISRAGFFPAPPQVADEFLRSWLDDILLRAGPFTGTRR